MILGGGALLNQAGRALTTAGDRLFARVGLTSQQAALLLHTAHGECTPKELTALLGTDTAGITRLLDRLERKRLLRRLPHPEDRRSVLVQLTDEGRPLISDLPPLFGKLSQRAFDGFTENEIAVMGALLTHILNNLLEQIDE